MSANKIEIPNCPENCQAFHRITEVAALMDTSPAIIEGLIKQGVLRCARAGDSKSTQSWRVRHEWIEEYFTLGFDAADISDTDGYLLGRVPNLRRCISGFVYLVELGGVHKVGKSGNPKTRFASYRSLPFEFTEHHKIKVDDMDGFEEYLHSILARWRIKGKEWYRLERKQVRWFCIQTKESLEGIVYGIKHGPAAR